MRTLNIEDTVVCELPDQLYGRIAKMNAKIFEDREGEIFLRGNNLQDKASVVHGLIVLYAADISNSFAKYDPAIRIDFRMSIIPQLLECQKKLESLTIDGTDRESYWDLVGILSDVLSFKRKMSPESTVSLKEI